MRVGVCVCVHGVHAVRVFRSALLVTANIARFYLGGSFTPSFSSTFLVEPLPREHHHGRRTRLVEYPNRGTSGK